MCVRQGLASIGFAGMAMVTAMYYLLYNETGGSVKELCLIFIEKNKKILGGDTKKQNFAGNRTDWNGFSESVWKNFDTMTERVAP